MTEKTSDRSHVAFSSIPFVWSAPISTDLPASFVAAVSNAGGLGVVPADDVTDPATYFASFRNLTKKPFAVALRVPDVKAYPLTKEKAQYWAKVFVERYGELLSRYLPECTEESLAERFASFHPLASFEERFRFWLAAGPALMISTFGAFREPEEDALREAGILNVATATTLREAKVARAARVDAIVVQGADAGGPRWSSVDTGTGASSVFSLLPHVKRATGLPLIAAGGIVTQEHAQAARALGAEALLVGSAFLGTEEAKADGFYQWAATESDATDYVTGPLEGANEARYLRNDFVLERLSLINAPRPPAGLFEPWTTLLRKRVAEAGDGALMALSLSTGAGRIPYTRVVDVVRTLSV